MTKEDLAVLAIRYTTVDDFRDLVNNIHKPIVTYAMKAGMSSTNVDAIHNEVKSAIILAMYKVGFLPIEAEKND